MYYTKNVLDTMQIAAKEYTIKRCTPNETQSAKKETYMNQLLKPQ